MYVCATIPLITMASLGNMSAFEQWFDIAATRGPDRVIPSSVAIAVTKDGISLPIY